MKDKKRETFIYKGLGFPIKLVNVPMKKMFGKWCIDINMNKLMLLVLDVLAHKPVALTGDELRFVRSYLKMTTTAFGKLFGVSHAAVLKWENGQNKASAALEAYIRLYLMDYLKAKDKEFRQLFSQLSLEKLSKSRQEKKRPIEVDATLEDLKIAL